MGRATELLDVVIPAGCAVCGAAVAGELPPLCGVCRSRLPAVNPPWCPRCGATRFGDFASAGLCPECETWPRVLHRAAAPFRHAPPAADLVHGLKYRGWTALGSLMGSAMSNAARRVTEGRHVVLVPVPLAPARLRERGFNHALLLARGLSTATGWPVRELLLRRRMGPAQVSLRRRERERRVRELYAVSKSICGRDAMEAGSGSARSLGCLVVDDVLTTGSTAAACADVLSAAGFDCLGAVSFSRALPRAEEEE